MIPASSIEAALLAMNSPQENDNNIRLLNEWTQQPESIFTALDLVCDSNNTNVKISCSSFLSHSIVIFWSQIDQEQKNDFREKIIIFALSYESKDSIFKYILAVIAHIAVFDWPDEWEEFTSVLLPSESQTDTFYLNSLKIFHKFVKNIQISPNITESHRSLLINYFIEQITEIIDYLTKLLDEPLFTKSVLSILRYLFLWIPNEDSVLPSIYEKIIFEFLPNEETLTVSLKCLASIFLLRSDSSISFCLYSPYLIQTISNSTFSNNHPISSNSNVVEFIIRFLNLYMIAYQIVFVMDQIKEEPRLSSLIDISVDDLYDTITTKDISIDDLKTDFFHLYQVILSIQVEDITETFWQLWFNILRQIKSEKLCIFKVNPATEFFQPILPDILQSLYNALPSAVNEDGILIYQARGCFNSLFDIDTEMFFEFINGQSPCVNLCYLIGILEFVNGSTESNQSLSRIVIELFDTLDQSTDSQYVSSLLFCLSHSASFFHDNNELFSRFIDFVINCMSDEDSLISDAASQALSYVVNNRVGLFRGESKEFTENIIEQTENFFSNLNKQSAFIMYKTCTHLICQNDQVSNAKNLFQSLFDPLLSFLSEFLDEAKQVIQDDDDLIEFQLRKTSDDKESNVLIEKVQYAIEIINECTNANYFAATHFFDSVWPVLFELSQTVTANSGFNSDLVSTCLNAIGWIQVNLNPAEIDEIDLMQQTFQSMVNRGFVDESIFDYIAIIKEHDEDDSDKIESLYPFILENFIEPALNENIDDIPYRAILRMLASFSMDSVDIQWVTALGIEGIRDARKEVNLAAIQCLRHVLSNASNEQFQEFVENCQNSVISALIECITDGIHKIMTVKNIDFLRAIINVNSFDQVHKILKPAIVQAFKQVSFEPSDGFFENFTDYILSIHRMYTQFKEAFLDMLIMLKKATPGDLKLFELEPVHQNIIFEDIVKSNPTVEI